ncbi:ANTAR domain-containing protein [Streptomyces sp. NBC_00728]
MRERVDELFEERRWAQDSAGELRDENAQLRQALGSHAVVDQAIGVLLAVGQLRPDQGRHVLSKVSQRTGIKLRHVAELLIEWARTGQLCTDIRHELDQQLAQYADTGTAVPGMPPPTATPRTADTG